MKLNPMNTYFDIHLDYRMTTIAVEKISLYCGFLVLQSDIPCSAQVDEHKLLAYLATTQADLSTVNKFLLVL